MRKTNNRLIVSVVILIFIGIISSIFLFSVLMVNDPYYKSSQLIKAIEKKDYEKLEKMLSDGSNPIFPEHRISKIYEILGFVPRLPI